MRNFIMGSLIATGVLQGCTEAPPAVTEAELHAYMTELRRKTWDNLVFIEGGTFTMGDFGAVGEDGVWLPYFPLTMDEDRPHEATLSDYSMSKQKTTWADFDTYLLANNLPVIERVFSDIWDRVPFDQDIPSRFFVNKPARATWQEAKDYCLWLGQHTQLPLDLPTSAQWEFAGRNRGSKAWIFSTHDGKHLKNDSELARRVYDGPKFVPVGSRLPPNPLGLYDMYDNGKEWINDWFSETYYRENPKITDPQGPKQGTKKVTRNLDFSFHGWERRSHYLACPIRNGTGQSLTPSAAPSKAPPLRQNSTCDSIRPANDLPDCVLPQQLAFGNKLADQLRV